MKILLASTLGQPRIIRRIKALPKDSLVYFIDRDYFQNELPGHVEYVNLGSLDVQFGMVKINLRLLKFLFAHRRAITELYVTSYHLSFIALLVRCDLKVMEISDVRVGGRLSYLFMLLVRFYELVYDRIVVTSPAFKEFLALPNKGHKYCVVANADFSCYPRRIKKLCVSDRYVIGVIGLFRYTNIITLLSCYQSIKNDFEIHFYGDGPLAPEIKRRVDNVNIRWLGRFKSPEDLASIYSKVDFSFVCYDSSITNVRLAEPNKLYESIFYQVPIIVSADTYLAKRVSDLNIGVVVEDELKSVINGLNELKNNNKKFQASCDVALNSFE